VTVITICGQDSPVNLNLDHVPAKSVALQRISEQCLRFWHKDSISPSLSPCQIRLANVQCRICHNVTQIICWWYSGAPERRSYGSISCGFARDQQASVSYSDTVIHYLFDWLYCPVGLPNLQCTIYLNETQDIWLGFSGAPERGWTRIFFLLTSKCIHGLRFPVNLKLTTDEWFEALQRIIPKIRLQPFILR